jgi:hypothetical protein
MEYSLKDKIEVTEEFLNELIAKNWQETDALQQQIANIDTSTQLGAKVARVLKNTCTNYYVLIGCLESLIEGDIPQREFITKDEHDDMSVEPEIETPQEHLATVDNQELSPNAEINTNFEPFEYFVDFDEPCGEPITDKDLYN